MALKKSTGHSDFRIYEPSFACEYSSREEDAEHRSCLMGKIHNAYIKAFERLTISSKARRSVAMRVLGGGGGGGGLGFGFGLLDPTSNIIANTLIPCQRDLAEKGRGKGEAAACGVEMGTELKELESRSLDGMVAFLTRFFPYLADCEAVRYLLLADADLLVATRIIVVDRRMKRFGSSELAVEEALRMALRCAALAAKHPDPDRFLSAWLTISSRLDEAVSLLAKVRRRSPSSSLCNLEKLLRGPLPHVDDRRGDLLLAWQLAKSRRPLPHIVPYQNSSTGLKRALLDAIHGFYLQALARLPAGELRSRYQRSLLMAGHCYGPLDPVSNIILNTIWYDAVFPPAMELELGMGMISTPGLLRIETRSMYGLVSFLCTRYHHLNFHLAMRCLLEADGSLLLADPNLDAEAAAATIAILRMKEPTRPHAPWRAFHSVLGSRMATRAHFPATSVNEAFKAAAIAAWHPNADAQANLFTSCETMIGSALHLLQGGSQLSTEDAQQLAKLLISPNESPCKKPPLIPLPSKEYVRGCTTVTEKINDVLNAYASMTNGEPTYQLHAICSVNDQVSGPVYCPESNACPPEKFYHSHVNFLATPRYTSHGNEVPVLFFAEFSNDDEHKAETQPLCYPVCIPPPCSERVRCLYCDYVGIRIIHPVGNNFHGREEDFENMVCKKDPFDEDFDPALMLQYYTNMAIISGSSVMAERIGRLEEDRLYESNEDDSDSDYTSDEC